MKNLLTTTAVSLLPLTAAADGYTTIAFEPTVIPPAAHSWSGLYGGGMIGLQRSITREHVGTTYVRECREGVDLKDSHNSNKCVVSQYDWENSPEIQALEHNDRPWREDEFYRFVQPNYYGVWTGSRDDEKQAVLRYTTDRLTEAPDVGKPSTNLLIDTIEHYDESQEVELASGVYAGYRHDFGRVVVGVEAWGVVGFSDAYTWAVEPQVGYDAGNALYYIGTASVGADWMVTDNTFLGLKAYSVDDHSGIAARYGWAF